MSSSSRAEGEKQARILAAEAAKQEKIRMAEGEAEAILKVKQTMADGIQKINSSNPSAEYLKIRAMEALEKVGDGNATKIIIPSEIQNVAGFVTTVAEIAKENVGKGGNE